MSDTSESPRVKSIESKTLYRHHTNASREIALVDLLNNDTYTQPNNHVNSTNEGLTLHDQEDMYRMGKTQELKVR
jgi:hypothetical protein